MNTPEDFAALQPVVPIEESAGILSRMRENVMLRSILPGAIALGGVGVAVAYSSEGSALAANSTNRPAAVERLQFETSTIATDHAEHTATTTQPDLVIKIRKHLMEGKYARVLIHDLTKPAREITTIDGKFEKHFTVERYMDYTQPVLIPKGSHVFRVYLGKLTKSEIQTHPREHLLAERMLHRRAK